MRAEDNSSGKKVSRTDPQLETSTTRLLSVETWNRWLMSMSDKEIEEWVENSEEPNITVFSLVIIILLTSLMLLALFLSVFEIEYGIERAKEDIISILGELTNS